MDLFQGYLQYVVWQSRQCQRVCVHLPVRDAYNVLFERKATVRIVQLTILIVHSVHGISECGNPGECSPTTRQPHEGVTQGHCPRAE